MLLDDNTKEQIRAIFKDMKDPITLIYFPNESNPYNKDIWELLNEIKELSDKITIIQGEEGKEEEYEVKYKPAIVVKGKNKGNIQFCGIPAGHEFTTFIYQLVDCSTGGVTIPSDIAKEIENIEEKVSLDVFITLACPHCPGAVKLAMEFAMKNEKFTARMIEAQEFPQEAARNNVSAVPHTVVNELHSFVGAYPPEAAVQEIKKAISK